LAAVVAAHVGPFAQASLDEALAAGRALLARGTCGFQPALQVDAIETMAAGDSPTGARVVTLARGLGTPEAVARGVRAAAPTGA